MEEWKNKYEKWMGNRNDSTETMSLNLSLGDSQQVEFDFPSQRQASSQSVEERNDHMVSSDDDESETDPTVIKRLSQDTSTDTEPFVTANLFNLDIQNEVEIECHEGNLEESDNEIIRPVGKHSRRLSRSYDSHLPSPILSTPIVSETIQQIRTLDQAITDFVRPLVSSQMVSVESQNVEAMGTTSSPIIKVETHTQHSQTQNSVIYVPPIEQEIIEIDDSQNNDVRDLLSLDNSDSPDTPSKTIPKTAATSMPQTEIRMPSVSISNNMASLQITDNISFNPPQTSTQVSK